MIAVRTQSNRLRDALFDRLWAHFAEGQIVQLTLRITMCGFFNKFNNVLRVEEEAEAIEQAAPFGVSHGLGSAATSVANRDDPGRS